MNKHIELILDTAKSKGRCVLTKKDLLSLLENISDNAPIRVSVRIEDVARSRKISKKNKHTLEFDLCHETEVDENGCLLNAWVNPERLPSEQKKITGTLLVEREVGVVKWFNDAKGLGFILRDQGEDVFVHYEAIRGDGYRCLRSGSKVEYSLYETNKGLQAQDVVQLSVPETEELDINI